LGRIDAADVVKLIRFYESRKSCKSDGELRGHALVNSCEFPYERDELARAFWEKAPPTLGDTGCSLSLVPLARFVDGGAEARPDHPISAPPLLGAGPGSLWSPLRCRVESLRCRRVGLWRT
jgi:hypothetical protein